MRVHLACLSACSMFQAGRVTQPESDNAPKCCGAQVRTLTGKHRRARICVMGCTFPLPHVPIQPHSPIQLCSHIVYARFCQSSCLSGATAAISTACASCAASAWCSAVITTINAVSFKIRPQQDGCCRHWADSSSPCTLDSGCRGWRRFQSVCRTEG